MKSTAEFSPAFPPPEPEKKLSAQNLWAGMIGNVLEWYDFGLYGYLAPVIARLFFPSTNPIASLLGAYAGFAIGFAMRPLGGVVLGHLGDRVGRKTVMVLSTVLMGVATTAIAFLPTYAQVGLLAPILLLAIRLFQGFSVGGEFTGSVTYLVETAPAKHRGLAGSVSNIGASGGYLLATGLSALTFAYSSAHPDAHWVWRAPFVVGGLIALFAFVIRNGLVDEGYVPAPPTEGKAHEWPLVQAFKRNPRTMLLVVLFTWGYGVADYVAFVFLPTFASKFGHLPEATALTINTIAIAVAIVATPLAGWLTDRAIRRRSLLMLAFGAMFLAAMPTFALAAGEGVVGFAIAQLLFAVFLGAVFGVVPTLMTELFHAEHRLSGYATSFNIGIGFGGGTAPLIATALIGATGSTFSAAGYLMANAALAVVALYLMKDRSREALL